MRKDDHNNAGLDHIDMKRRRIGSQPSPNGINGRRPDGKFAKNNCGGPGNPLGRQVQAIRVALVSAISVEDIQAVVQALIKKAKKGDVVAAKILFERTAGPAAALDLDLRLAELEDRVLGLRSEEK